MSRPTDGDDGTFLELSHLRIAVTGGGGFLGRSVVDELRRLGCLEDRVLVVRSSRFDLREKAGCRRLYEELAPDVVIHLAAVVAGIGGNRVHPGRFLYENLVMGTELVEEGRRYGRLRRFVAIGTVCAYPKHTPVPFKEDDLWNGYPEETNAPYGLAKRMVLSQLQAYRAEYGFPGVFLLPANLYGPGDNFDLATSHVIPAIIRKVDDAVRTGASYVELWGDGTPTREFLHVRDAARGIVLATQRYGAAEPVNLGTGRELAIRDVAALISSRMGFTGTFAWRPDMPGGQPRRCLDTSRGELAFGFRATTSLEEGLDETIAWWRKQPRPG